MIKGLDKWLTTPPDDMYYNWVEEVSDNYDDFMYEFLDTPKEIDATDKLFEKEYAPKRAAAIISRYFQIYFKK